MLDFLKSDTINKKMLWTAVILFVLFDFFLYHLINIRFYKSHFFLYAFFQNSIGYTTAWILGLWNTSALFIANKGIILINNKGFDIHERWGVLRLFYVSVLVFVYPLPIKKTISLYFIGCTIAFSLLISRLVIKQITQFDVIATPHFDTLFNLLYVLIVLYKVKHNFGLRRIYVQCENILSTTYIKSIKIILYLLATISSIGAIFLYFFEKSLLHFILLSTQKLLFIAGYSVTIIHDNIFLDSSSVYVGSYCLGVRLMLLFSISILVVKGSFKSKFLFIIPGIVVIIYLNVLRIMFLLLYLHTYHSISLMIELHDVFNYSIYAVILLLWFLFDRWFKYVIDGRTVNEIN